MKKLIGIQFDPDNERVIVVTKAQARRVLEALDLLGAVKRSLNGVSECSLPTPEVREELMEITRTMNHFYI